MFATHSLRLAIRKRNFRGLISPLLHAFFQIRYVDLQMRSSELSMLAPLVLPKASRCCSMPSPALPRERRDSPLSAAGAPGRCDVTSKKPAPRTHAFSSHREIRFNIFSKPTFMSIRAFRTVLHMRRSRPSPAASRSSSPRTPEPRNFSVARLTALSFQPAMPTLSPKPCKPYTRAPRERAISLRPLRPSRVTHKLAATKRAYATRHSISLRDPVPGTVFIAGTGRSGTTWLAELLVRGSRRRLIFEPFRNDLVPVWKGALSRQYIRPEDDSTPLLAPARAIMQGEIRDAWFDSLNSRLFTSGRVIKDIRANLLLGWLQRQFGPFPILYMIRNPEAVAASWQREGWPTSGVDDLLSQPELIDDHLGPFQEALRTATSPLSDSCTSGASRHSYL